MFSSTVELKIVLPMINSKLAFRNCMVRLIAPFNEMGYPSEKGRTAAKNPVKPEEWLWPCLPCLKSLTSSKPSTSLSMSVSLCFLVVQ